MAALTVARSVIGGVAPNVQAAAAGGDTVVNNGRTILWIDNASAGSITVTVDSEQLCSQGSTHDQTIVVPATSKRVAGPFDPTRFTSQLVLAYTGVTSLTIAPIDTTPSF